jgi:hypothetical protein
VVRGTWEVRSSRARESYAGKMTTTRRELDAQVKDDAGLALGQKKSAML